MKSHVYRPLYVVIALVVVILAARAVFVPADFGAHERGYRFGWHKKSNEEYWKKLPAKYSERTYCNDCHDDKVKALAETPHAIINCQNCHGPALKHPEEPAKLTIDRSREQCLRCHAKLTMPGSGRAKIRGIKDADHNQGAMCVDCHNPHSPKIS